MIVRWSREQTNLSINGRGYTLGAVVEFNRMSSDTARQNADISLGTIEERYLKAKVRTLREFHQGLFWVSVDKNLDRLKIDSATRSRIEQKISGRIPRPSSEWALWGVICVPKFDT